MTEEWRSMSVLEKTLKDDMAARKKISNNYGGLSQVLVLRGLGNSFKL